MTLNYKRIKHSYYKDGFAVIKNFLSKKETNEFKENIFKEIEKSKIKFRSRYINFTKNGSINSLHGLDRFSSVKKLKSDKRIQKIINHILGDNYDNFGSELFAKPARTGLGVPVHQDNKYWCLQNENALTMWFALEKSNKNNGGIFYYKGSHLLGLLEHEPSYAPGSSQKLKYQDALIYFKKFCPSLNTGDCLIHNCMVVHGSDKNFSKSSRSALTLRFKQKNNNIRKDLQKQYEKELKLQLKKRK